MIDLVMIVWSLFLWAGGVTIHCSTGTFQFFLLVLAGLSWRACLMLSQLEAGLRAVAELPVSRALRPAAPRVFGRLRSAIARREELG